MGLHEDAVDTYDDAVSFLYLGSILGSLGFFIGIRYCLKHKTYLRKKYDVWKILDKFSSYRSVLATSFFAITAALAGGLLNSADEGIFFRAVLYAIPAGILCAILTGSPILFVTGAIFTYTGILQSPVCPESMILAKDCLNKTNAFGSFDWFLGTPSPSWTEESRWSHDMIDLTLRGLMWTIPLGLPIRSYRYSSLISFSGLAMGLAYHAGSSLAAPFPLCLMGLSPGMSLGDFYMGAYMFFIITVCLLGSNHPMSATRGSETRQDSTSPAKVTTAPTVVVDVRGYESEKQFLKTRVLNTDTETDEEPLAVATVIGRPVSSPSPATPPSTSALPNTNTHKFRRCGRPVHGSRAMQCCWAAHFFLSLFLISATVFVLCIWWDYSPERLEKIDSATDNDDGLFFGWDSWYLWLLVFFLVTFSYRSRRRGRRCCCRRLSSGQ